MTNTAPRAISEIVLTGGPCAGKTTAMAALSAKLTDWGFRVLVCPEVATLLISAGIPDIGEIAGSDGRHFTEIEIAMLRTQRALRARFRELAAGFAARGQRVVVLYDRGECDTIAYIGHDAFGAICQEERLTAADVRDSYDGVIHLVTAAIGAPEAYTLANNAARTETPAQAAALDERTLAAWVGQPHLRIIDNTSDFATKIRRTVGAVAGLVGIPEPLEIERKWRLSRVPDAGTLASLNATSLEIEQVYLRTSDPAVEIRVRRRGPIGAATYTRTRKERRSTTTRVETEELISPTEYLAALAEADPTRHPIRKTRHCFVSGTTYFELDVFADRELAILEAELGDEADAVTLPAAFVDAVEVTDDPAFTNAALAAAA